MWIQKISTYLARPRFVCRATKSSRYWRSTSADALTNDMADIIANIARKEDSWHRTLYYMFYAYIYSECIHQKRRAICSMYRIARRLCDATRKLTACRNALLCDLGLHCAVVCVYPLSRIGISLRVGCNRPSRFRNHACTPIHHPLSAQRHTMCCDAARVFNSHRLDDKLRESA